MDKLLFWLTVAVVAIVGSWLFKTLVNAWSGAPGGLQSFAQNS